MALDRVTFEVLKNAYGNLVDQMSEQLLRTCYSFVIYSRDFSNCLCDAKGNTVMQGAGDIAVHVGTLHFTCQSIIDRFKDDIHPGDIFMSNDPYTGGTHFCDVRIVRPVFVDGALIAFTQSNGHWADVGGSVPGSFDINARTHFGEGLRITPMRICTKGHMLDDVIEMIVGNTRASRDAMGDFLAQCEATRLGEQRLLELVDKYGKDTVIEAFEECQDYVERFARDKVEALPDGEWHAVDFIDQDPTKPEGLIPVRAKMTIKGSQVIYDFSGSHEAIDCFLNGSYSSAFSAVVAGSKFFFPEVPLNSGFYRFIDANLPEGTVVNAPYPYAVTGFCSGAYEKIMNAIFALWSQVMPERALCCSFNLEYLLIGGTDERPETRGNFFMWYDWMAGGWGARNGKDGSSATSSLFGVGLAQQSVEAQERLTPIVMDRYEIAADSGGPGKFRGGCGLEKGGTLTSIKNTVMSYCCDRARALTWGMKGGQPSVPHGVTHTKENEPHFLGAVFSNVPVEGRDKFMRPSAGGGGLFDPLEREPAMVVEDVIDGYVSLEGAKRDYGVVIDPVDPELDDYEVNEAATSALRDELRSARESWLDAPAEEVAAKLQSGEIDRHTAIRRHGVICDWDTNELLSHSTEQFRAAAKERMLDGDW